MATVHSELSGRARRAALAGSGRNRESTVRPQPHDHKILAPAVDLTICLLFASGIFVLMFHAWDYGNIALAAQVIGAALMLSAGGLAWLAGFKFSPLSPVELCLLAMWFLSLVMLFFNSEVSPETIRTSLGVSAIFVFAVVGNAALIRRVPMDRLLNVSAAALAIAIIPVLVMESNALVEALSLGGRWRTRLAPMGLHPALTSVIFSLGILLSVYRIVTGKLLVKAIFSFVLLLQAAIVLASGGRTGVVACVASLTLVFVMRMRRTPPIVWFGVLVAAAGSLWYFEQAWDYVSTVFELESEERGWGSGATGRTELWAEAVELILADFGRLLLGSGLRTAGPEEIGFQTDNSYITLVLEHGAIMTSWFVIALLATVVRLHYHATDPDKDTRVILYGLLPIIQFALIAGLFYRQMVSVGNPASMIFLVVYAGAWVYVSGPKQVSKTVGPLEAKEVPEPGAERRRRRAAEQALTPTSEVLLSSRAMLRRLRARGAADLA